MQLCRAANGAATVARTESLRSRTLQQEVIPLSSAIVRLATTAALNNSSKRGMLYLNTACLLAICDLTLEQNSSAMCDRCRNAARGASRRTDSQTHQAPAGQKNGCRRPALVDPKHDIALPFRTMRNQKHTPLEPCLALDRAMIHSTVGEALLATTVSLLPAVHAYASVVFRSRRRYQS